MQRVTAGSCTPMLVIQTLQRRDQVTRRRISKLAPNAGLVAGTLCSQYKYRATRYGWPHILSLSPVCYPLVGWLVGWLLIVSFILLTRHYHILFSSHAVINISSGRNFKHCKYNIFFVAVLFLIVLDLSLFLNATNTVAVFLLFSPLNKAWQFFCIFIRTWLYSISGNICLHVSHSCWVACFFIEL